MKKIIPVTITLLLISQIAVFAGESKQHRGHGRREGITAQPQG